MELFDLPEHGSQEKRTEASDEINLSIESEGLMGRFSGAPDLLINLPKNEHTPID